MQNNSKFKRDPETGLIIDFQYPLKEDGSVNYRALLKPEHLYVPKDKIPLIEKKYGKPLQDIDLTQAEDRFLAVTMKGLRHICFLRGFKSIKNKVDSVSYDQGYQVTSACTHTCTIKWIGNFETGMQEVTTSDSAEASLSNVGVFMKPFIVTASANRAFCRTVRFFLGLDSIVSKEEIFEGKFELLEKQEESAAPSSTGSDPLDLLRAHMKSMGLDFTKLKDNIVKRYADLIKNSAPSEWTDLETIPKNDIFTIIGILVKSKEASNKK